MIKSFKDFDYELNGQKVYESVDDNFENNKFSKEDVIVPDMVYNNKYLSKISKIILKKLNNAGLGNFGYHTMIVDIDNVPGVYFYNYDDPSINIVICRNTYGKHVYLFKEFNLGETNVATFVLSTHKVGFLDIINMLINKIVPKTIEEGIICEWSDGGTTPQFQFTEENVESAVKMNNKIRENILSLFLNKISGKLPKFGNVCNAVITGYKSGEQDFIDIYNEIESKCYSGKKFNESFLKKILNIFYYAANGLSTHHDEMEKLFIGTKYKYDGGSVTLEESVDAHILDGASSYDGEEFKSEYEEDMKKFKTDMGDIYDLATSMCKYVKKRGSLDDDEMSGLTSRGMLITGLGGIGKSASIRKALKEQNMHKNIDYYEMTSGNTSASEIYKKLYDFNGKLIIFDDSGALFDTEYKQGLWKHAFEPRIENCEIGYPGRSTDTDTYPNYRKSRQERYFLEVGHSSPAEEEKFRKKEMEKLEKKYRDETGHSARHLPEKVLTDHKLIVDELWAEREEDKSPKMPTSFNYKGCAVIISNLSRKALGQKIEKANWGAIASRMVGYDLNPIPEVIWAVVKEQLINEKDDSSLTDYDRMIPKKFTDEFIEEVEKNLADGDKYRTINYRIVADYMHKTLMGSEGIKKWKRILKMLMNSKL